MKTKINTNEVTSVVSAEDKAAMHIFVIPTIIAIIMFLLGSKLWFVGSVIYVVLMVLYFNIKAIVVKSTDSLQDRNQINDFAGKGTTLIMGIVLAILILGID